jgi:8-oxo-dGTP diphosphatase
MPDGVFAVTVDLVLLTIRAGELMILLVRRGVPPYRGRWALPGGFVKVEEDLPAAAVRELTEETGVASTAAHLEQLGTYGAPRRDPRGRVVTVAYLALLPDLPRPVAGTDAAAAAWHPVASPPRLALDHARIAADGIERARAKLEYTTLATAFLDEPFTLGDLRRVYEAVWAESLHEGNFRRKVLSTPGFVEPTGQSARTDGRPAALYRRGGALRLHPAILRG